MIADTLARPVAFTGGTLDRADHLRQNAAAMADLQAGGRLLLLDGIDPRLVDGGLVWGEMAQADAAELVFLGVDAGGQGAFAPVPPPEQSNVGPASPALWAAMASITPGDLATYGLARSLVGWHARHRFCPRCGSATVIGKGGWQRCCVNEVCGASHFPRTDPVVIMSVEHDGDLLLGRQPQFPAGRYSTLAGFVEPGEALEEAVAREIFEEAGLVVEDVRFVASQPWPFPSSLMLGCHARALTREITMDATELEDARWFTRAQVVQAMEARERGEDGLAFSAPGKHAVAWHLMDRWVRGV
jgi:NAD+ diphosphatase